MEIGKVNRPFLMQERSFSFLSGVSVVVLSPEHILISASGESFGNKHSSLLKASNMNSKTLWVFIPLVMNHDGLHKESRPYLVRIRLCC